MKYPLIAAVLICLCGTAFAEVSKIEGAFGMELGQDFNPDAAIGKGSLTDGTPMYKFAPASPFRSFTRYYVLITPKTNKVYAIWGLGSFENQGKAEKEAALLMEILQEKYGEKEKQGLVGGLYDMETIANGDRTIVLKISGMMDITMDIRYIDNELTKLAEKERLQLEAEKVDASGL